MSIATNRRANRKLAEYQMRRGRVPLIEEARLGLLSDPYAWAQSGFRLVRAAMMLIETAQKGTDALMELLSGSRVVSPSPEIAAARDDAELWTVAQMLLGMGFECLLKCLLAHRGTEVPLRGRKGHNLVDLAQTSQIKLSTQALDLLEELTVMNQLGRYPAHCDENMPSMYAMGMDMAAVLEIMDAITKSFPAQLQIP